MRSMLKFTCCVHKHPDEWILYERYFTCLLIPTWRSLPCKTQGPLGSSTYPWVASDSQSNASTLRATACPVLLRWTCPRWVCCSQHRLECYLNTENNSNKNHIVLLWTMQEGRRTQTHCLFACWWNRKPYYRKSNARPTGTHITVANKKNCFSTFLGRSVSSRTVCLLPAPFGTIGTISAQTLFMCEVQALNGVKQR